MQPELKQMLLVLQSIHRNPPTEHYYTLQSLVKQVVHPYMCLVTSPKLKQPQGGRGGVGKGRWEGLVRVGKGRRD